MNNSVYNTASVRFTLCTLCL